MYDPKTIRRRRAVLALLVVICVVLLTASFGGGGGAGSVQRGVFEIVSPVQDVASRSLKPVRDMFGWFGDTWRAKGQNDNLRKDRDSLRQQNMRLRADLRNAQVAQGIARIDATASLDQLGPVGARVIGVTPNLLYQSFKVNKGAGSGVRSGQAVVTAGGLVGRVTVVAGGYSTVRLLTDSSFGVSARVGKIGQPGEPGVVTASGGSPTDLKMETTDVRAAVAEGSVVATRGTTAGSDFKSLFPPDIPIGKVTSVDDAGTDTQVIHLRPFVDVRDVDHVQILTKDPSGLG